MDLASVSTTTTTRSLHRRTVTIRSASSDEYHTSQEDLPTNHDTRELDECRLPNPEPEDPGTSTWHIRAAQEAADPWGDAAPSNAANDPEYPTGAWAPGDRERALLQNKQQAPDPLFTLDNVYIKDEHIDASPPYFTRAALAAPRSRAGPHSPHYSRADPFATLRQNSVPFPAERRRYILPVPFGQWPDESDTSDSSDESDRGRQRQRGSDPPGTRVEQSLPHLDHSQARDPFNWEGPDYEWNELEQIDRDILGPEAVEAWELRRADIEARTSWHHAGTREHMEYYLTTNWGSPFHFGTPTNREIMARVHTNRNQELYRTHPGHRRPDLRAQTEEEEQLLREQLERLTLQYDERLWREDNSY